MKQIVISGDDIEHVFGFIENELNNANIYTTMRIEDVEAIKRQRDGLMAALNLIETDKDGDGFICREAMDQVRQAINATQETA